MVQFLTKMELIKNCESELNKINYHVDQSGIELELTPTI